MEHIICLGSSAASISCAAQIKRLDKNTHVTILTAQSEMPNNTCLLADYVSEQRSKQSLYLPIPEDVSIHYNSGVIALNASEKTVLTKNGQQYEYDKLFIGTGLKPRVPEVFIPELYKKVFPFKSLDDIVRFEQQESTGKNVLVVGGGVTGIEACHALKIRGYNVTLVEKNARLLPNSNQVISQRIHELLQEYGVSVHTNYQISHNVVHEFDTILLRYDAVFLAMGGVPATDFLQNQISLDNGFITVNGNLQTTDTRIFAGGDCVKGRVLWPQAVRDGILAAYSILTHPAPNFKQIDYKTVIRIFNTTFVL